MRWKIQNTASIEHYLHVIDGQIIFVSIRQQKAARPLGLRRVREKIEKSPSHLRRGAHPLYTSPKSPHPVFGIVEQITMEIESHYQSVRKSRVWSYSPPITAQSFSCGQTTGPRVICEILCNDIAFFGKKIFHG